MPENTDDKLIFAIRENDYISYNKLFVRYHGKLCQYVYSLVVNKEEAQDIVQELFLNLWKHRKRIYIAEGSASGYLYKMAKNLSLNHLRSKKNYQNFLEKYGKTELQNEDDLSENEAFSIALYDCIDKLPQRCKDILILHRFKGLKQKEIAKNLGISVQTVKNQIWSTLRKLKNCLESKKEPLF